MLLFIILQYFVSPGIIELHSVTVDYGEWYSWLLVTQAYSHICHDLTICVNR